jgi:hypothetical protein
MVGAKSAVVSLRALFHSGLSLAPRSHVATPKVVSAVTIDMRAWGAEAGPGIDILASPEPGARGLYRTLSHDRLRADGMPAPRSGGCC